MSQEQQSQQSFWDRFWDCPEWLMLLLNGFQSILNRVRAWECTQWLKPIWVKIVNFTKKIYSYKILDLLRLPEDWDNFIASVILIIFLPLLPLLLELLSTGEISSTSLTLVASFFTLALGASSKSKAFFAFSVFVGVIFASAYIIVLKEGFYIKLIERSAEVVIVVAIIVHAMERYARHRVDILKEPFLSWHYGKEEIAAKTSKLEKLEKREKELQQEYDLASQENNYNKATEILNEMKQTQNDMKKIKKTIEDSE